MPHWKLKAAIQGTISRLPNAQRWNRLFQRHVTRSLDLTEPYFLEKWGQCERHIANAAEAGKTHDFVALELGTGWFPISSIGLALAGAKAVYSVDHQSLLARDAVVATLESYMRMIKGGRVVLRPNAIERLDSVHGQKDSLSASELLKLLGVHCLVNDARHLDLPAGSIDVFTSNNTLEHIPGDVILDIFREFTRVGKADCLMSHYIDLADHYAGFDKNIGVLNFLRFSSDEWRWFNNDLQYQNRLRVNDFRTLHEQSGWILAREENTSASVTELRNLPPHAEFRHLSEADLVVYQSWMISRPKGH